MQAVDLACCSASILQLKNSGIFHVTMREIRLKLVLIYFTLWNLGLESDLYKSIVGDKLEDIPIFQNLNETVRRALCQRKGAHFYA
jgi:hypothetical protein